MKKITRSNCSNFFVFQSYELRFSGIFCLDLKRPFPGSFEFWDSQDEYPLAHNMYCKKVAILHLEGKFTQLR